MANIMNKRIAISVLPCSSRDQIVGELEDGTIKVKLAAAPVDGEANKKLIELLSKEWGIPKTSITIVRGHTSKHKIIEIKNGPLTSQ